MFAFLGRASVERVQRGLTVAECCVDWACGIRRIFSWLGYLCPDCPHLRKPDNKDEAMLNSLSAYAILLLDLR